MKVTAALNLHTSLTTSAGQGLSPVKLVEQLKKRKVQVAALTDVNTALNCPAFAVLCRSAGIAPLFGMEALNCSRCAGSHPLFRPGNGAFF
jgi:DNA polymerase III alpha subunit